MGIEIDVSSDSFMGVNYNYDFAILDINQTSDTDWITIASIMDMVLLSSCIRHSVVQLETQSKHL